MHSLPLLSWPIPPADLTERLGWCLLHFIWQGTAIAAALALLLRFCRQGTPELRHALCGMALAVMPAVAVLTWGRLEPTATRPDEISLPSFRMEAAAPNLADFFEGRPDGTNGPLILPEQEPVDGKSSKSAGASLPSLAGAALPQSHQSPWLRWLGWFWLAGAAAVTSWRALGLGATAWLIHRAGPAAEAINARADAMARRCGLRSTPLVRITHRLMSPAVAGVLRSVLLLPAAALARLSPRELDFIMAHEFAHIRRHDFLLGLLQAAVEALFFFHPAVWWITHRMGVEREQACDDAAMRVTGNRQAAAAALARLAELRLQSTPDLAPAAGGGHLLQRVRRLLEPQHPPRPSGSPLMLALLVLPGLVLTPFLMPRAESQDAPALEKTKPEPEVAALFPTIRGSITDRNGVVLAESVKGTRTRREVTSDSEDRRYPLGSLASHVVGYTKPDFDQLKMDDGAAGIEKLADAALEAIPTKSGKAQPSLTLTLDARFQQICLKALRGAGVGRGAAVILDVSNGDILAMASVPNFDPNDFVPNIKTEQWADLQQDETIPIINRALSGYPPGSTFKLITALAAGPTGDWKSQYACSGSVTYGGRNFNCWTVSVNAASHGTLALPDAVQRSCNCYFYQLGNTVGIDRVAGMAKNFGIGDSSSFRLGAPITDFMPDAVWWEPQNKGPWTEARTANISIGQGEVLATPLQMAGVAATIANGGKIWNPRIIAKALVNGSWQAAPLELRHDLIAEGVPAETIDALRRGMWKTVHSATGGTAKAAASHLIPIAGKTGTAQRWRVNAITKERIVDNHAQFIGFAPFEKPRYAFSIVVANAKSGGQVCAPIARQIMESIELLNRGELDVELKAEPAVSGHFKYLEAVTYPPMK